MLKYLRARQLGARTLTDGARHMATQEPEELKIPEFVQTARAQIEELDRWQQITEEEARL
jgi:hypothetical protein